MKLQRRNLLKALRIPIRDVWYIRRCERFASPSGNSLVIASRMLPRVCDSVVVPPPAKEESISTCHSSRMSCLLRTLHHLQI